jgi:hypothetical protein
MNRSMFGWVRAALLGSVVAGLAACGSSGSSDATTSGGTGCTPGAQTACVCPGDKKGVQTCAADGKSLNACQCGSTGSSGSGGAGGSSTGTQMETCGDGVQQAGECDPTSETHTYCAKDCDGTTATTTSASSSGTGGACAGHVYYAGMVPDITSVWVSGGLTSFAAGDDMCQKANLGGADHVCDYEEVLKAQTGGELSTVPAGTTIWVQRTTAANIGGVASAPGPGGRCNDWKYNTNHISDGEYGEFLTLGTPTFHLDNDTVYDNIPGAHNQPGLDCNGPKRAIMCCYAKCN